MTLQEIISNNATVELQSFGNDKPLAREVQKQLIQAGILDPPADGDFGQLSLLAWRKFANLMSPKFDVSKPLDARAAQALLDADVETLLPLQLDMTLASSIIRFMLAKKHYVARPTGYLNIVYVEGMNEDGSFNNDEFNKFNDCRMLITLQDGIPKIIGSWIGTTEPGKRSSNPGGAARIAFGQYKSWRVGTHGVTLSPRVRHEALVQADKIKIHRDSNMDGTRTGDPVFEGNAFGINQHWGFDGDKNDIKGISTGCLVGLTKAGHRQFMQLLKSDPRYEVSHGYKFMTTVIAGDELLANMGG